MLGSLSVVCVGFTLQVAMANAMRYDPGGPGLRRSMDVTSAGIEQTADLTSRQGFF